MNPSRNPSTNPSSRNGSVQVASPGAAEDTLRLIATLPAPSGLEERVKTRLASAPRAGRVLFWPSARGDGDAWRGGNAMRAAAAAAIVFVVAGGGWGVYSRVQPAQQTKVIVMQPRVNGTGGFSSAGAMRTPQTLNGPVLAHPVAEATAQANHEPSGTSATKKARRAKSTSSKEGAAQSIAR
jgi:hypothetical protein